MVDVDIKGYFVNIPHAPLMELVKERIADGKVLGLIESCLKQPVAEEGKEEVVPEKGSPQGPAGRTCEDGSVGADAPAVDPAQKA